MKRYKMRYAGDYKVYIRTIYLVSLTAGLALLLIIPGCGERARTYHPETELEELRRNLGLKTQTKWSHDVVNQVQFYDREGRLIEEHWLNPRGIVVTSRVLEYDEGTGWLDTTIWHRGLEALKSRNIFRYDRMGNLIEESWLTPFDEIRTRTEYVYEADRLLKELKYDMNDNLISTSHYNYEEGQLRELIVKDRRDRITSRQEYSYDTFGNLLEELWFDQEDELISRRLYSYDDEVVSGMTQYDKGEFAHYLEYEYDSDGLILRETWSNADEEIFFENLYTYEYY